MENDIGNLFLILEHYLIKDGTINNNVLTINNAKYNTIVLTPLLMDFGYRNIRSDTYYNIPPEKPIIEQTIDVFNGIRKYRNFELFENTSGNYEVYDRKNKAIFEIYPFLGINTQNYKLNKILIMLEKYFGDYTGTHADLFANLGTFQGNIESLGSNFFAGIKVYPPIGFDPWPEADGNELKKVMLIYSYCSEKKIPLTTHCSDGGFVLDEKNAETYTSPARWKKVLEEYPDIKLNFAHFGNQGNLLFIFQNRKWQKEIIQLMGKYQNVYTDFSCRAFNDGYYKFLKKVIGNDKNLLERILFGTDFMINLLWIDSYNEYLNKFRTTEYLSHREKELFCSTNPTRFLFT